MTFHVKRTLGKYNMSSLGKIKIYLTILLKYDIIRAE